MTPSTQSELLSTGKLAALVTQQRCRGRYAPTVPCWSLRSGSGDSGGSEAPSAWLIAPTSQVHLFGCPRLF